MKAQAALNLALTLVLPSEPGSPAAFQGIALGEILPVPKAAFGCGSHSFTLCTVDSVLAFVSIRDHTALNQSPVLSV